MNVLNYLITAILSFSFLSLATFGIVLIFKTSATTNFAQGTLGMLGAFVTSYFIEPSGINLGTGASGVVISNVFQILLPLLGGILVAFVFGYLIDVLIFRHAKFTNAVTKQIITMGLVITLTGLIPFIFGSSVTRWGFKFTEKTLALFNGKIHIQVHQIITLALAIIVIGGIFLLLKFTKWGLGVRSVASNEKVAGLMGINSNAINSLTWGIAGALGALSAITFTAGAGALNSAMMVDMQLNAFYSSILGGFGTFYGPLAGGLIYTVANGLLPAILVQFGITQWGPIIIYFLLMVTILIKPTGLFGKPVIKKV